jgi:hypothetical protein
MNRQSFAIMSAMIALTVGCFGVTSYAETAANTQDAVDFASIAVNEARASIENGKQLVVQIPADSEFTYEVKEILLAASVNWTIAGEALEGAKESVAQVGSSSSPEVVDRYQLLAKVNAYVASSGANVVKIGLLFVEAVAGNKTESLDLIRLSMQDAVAASSQVQFNYDRVKSYMVAKQRVMADASGIVAEVASLAVLAKMNLATAAINGDIGLMVEAAKRADAVDSALAEAHEAFADLERAQNEGTVAGSSAE